VALGVFTAPSHGLYYFSLHVFRGCALFKNGEEIVSVSRFMPPFGSNSAVLELYPGDEVYVVARFDRKPFYPNTMSSSFSGYLINHLFPIENNRD
uniref:C1q domain-containing protein n=1 Tax=Periophthalmus magnuspinnatus TaxID=409849 RepID=A0A3B3ZL21_9GOBI